MWCECITVSIIVVPVTRRHLDKWQINFNSGVGWKNEAELGTWMPLNIREFISFYLLIDHSFIKSFLSCTVAFI